MPIRLRLTPALTILGVIVIICFSFRILAPQFDPWLNSDHAVHVMMTYDLQLPNDLYYWGQDRLGSLVPIISHFLHRLLGLEPIVAVGLVNYVMLVLAYVCFASFLKQWFSRLVLAAAFFLPLRLYIEILHISQPYAAQFACMGLTTIGLRWLLNHWPTVPLWQRRVGIGLTMVAMVASLWMSDFSIVYLGIVLTAIAHHLFWRLSKGQRQTVYPITLIDGLVVAIMALLGWRLAKGQRQTVYSITLIDGLVVAIMALLGFGFLRLAKLSASNSSNYTKFNSIAQITDLISRMGQNFGRNLRFESNEVWLSVAAWCILLIATTLIFLIGRYRHHLFKQSFRSDGGTVPSTVESSNSGNNAEIDTNDISTETNHPVAVPLVPSILWVGSWGLTAGASMMILLVANWVYQSDHIAQRYFVVVYGFAWLTVLLLTELVPRGAGLVMTGLLVSLAIANVGSLYPRMTASVPPKVAQLEAIRDLAPAGFIGEYWYSYVLCSAEPDLFSCTPFDPWSEKRCPAGNGEPYELGYPISAVVRCERCAQNVIHSETVYLVKPQWLERFPKRIEQFGYCFERAGRVKKVMGYPMARYRRLDALIE
ncbi:MAG: hypothetical protein AB4042_11830 [Leptolyngbyaceae cyanobacterium]